MRRPNIHRLGMRKQRVCPHICIRGVPTQTPATEDWNKGQFARHAAIRGQNPNIEPGTLFVRVGRAHLAEGTACHQPGATPWESMPRLCWQFVFAARPHMAHNHALKPCLNKSSHAKTRNNDVA